jgi:hypothetical protein
VVIPGLPLVHIPPVGEPVKVAVDPTHIPVIPVMEGWGLMVTEFVAGAGQELTPFTDTETLYTPVTSGGCTEFKSVVVFV